MPRQERIWFPGLTYRIEAKGIRNSQLFYDEKDYSHYLYLLTKIKADCDFDLHAYCLLPNKIDLLIETFQTNLSTLMHRLQTNYAMYFNRRHQLRGHVFQGRYLSEPIKDETHFFESSQYIHLIPLRENKVNNLLHYRWSSARDYLSPQPEEEPLHPLLTLDRTLRLFPSPKHQHFEEFLFHFMREEIL
ncbi:transposase [Alteribacillus sp. YIM 98480]|uniref:transposase n=1 Tax=Alteribacillus sp. YIM 98480 TaxID=2606599 RepID=UPI00131C29A8|nr:transposase [Alteribacillus sp. YIM 98480]